MQLFVNSTYGIKAAVCCLMVLSICTTASNAQSFQVFHCMVDLEAPHKKVMQKLKIPEAILIDGRYIDPNKTLSIDSPALAKAIIQFFPGKFDTGVGLLDLEDDNFKALTGLSITKKTFEEGLSEMMRMLRIAKTLRPNVKWSLYNIPYTSYYDKDNNWKNQGERLKPLFELVDWLSPAIYDFYPDTIPHVDDRPYIEDNVKNALRIGKTFDKPVYPYIWQRWHEGNPHQGLQLIFQSEFARHLQILLQADVEGKRIEGFIWFDAPVYFQRVTPGLAAKDLQKVGGQPGKSVENMLRQYGEIIWKQASTYSR